MFLLVIKYVIIQQILFYDSLQCFLQVSIVPDHITEEHSDLLTNVTCFMSLQVGGEGLAAHSELYSYLHPSYLADAERLRAAVFGKLKAKGGFNGKTLAGVLPLLVHYVNEDFPLNAERKMRDVLTEIVIDGAFSGGAQYFQMSMQNPTLPPGARGKAGEGVLAKLERNESLNTLISTAFTVKELEDIMSAAGNVETCNIPSACR